MWLVLAVSVAAHLLAVWDIRGVEEPRRQGLWMLLFASVTLNVAGYGVRRVSLFRLTHAARCVALLAYLAVSGSGPMVATLLAAPYLVDGALFDEHRIAVPWGAAALALLGAAFAAPWFLSGSGLRMWDLAAYGLGAGLAGGLGILAVHYREENVRQSADILSLGQTADDLVEANEAFQLYAHNIESESAEKERNRITRELHDMIGYALTNVIVMMDAAPLLVREDPETLGELLGKVRAQAEDALRETRGILHRLRDIRELEPLGLRALHQLGRSFQGATRIEVTLNPGNLPWSFGRRLDAALFRLVQEGLTNAFRHGRATSVRINLWQTEGAILVSIFDNGTGIAPDGLEEGMGLRGMRERLEIFGGGIELRNRTDGFELLATIPYRMGKIGESHQSTDR
jgi:signal transduction histidine kinase